ncbi:MAG: hypothetical protein JXR95_01040 [Deltaproteobacteria bacterium]|nr:hypothetical protein [Deltaproteobacteria bacterium]
MAVQGKIISTRCYRKKLKFGYETGKTFIFTEAIIKVEDSSEQNLSEFITVLWPGGKIGNIVSTLKGFSPPAKEVRQLFFLNKNKTGDFVPVSMKGFTGKYLNKNIYFRGIKYRSETLKFFHRVSE